MYYLLPTAKLEWFWFWLWFHLANLFTHLYSWHTEEGAWECQVAEMSFPEKKQGEEVGHVNMD